MKIALLYAMTGEIESLLANCNIQPEILSGTSFYSLSDDLIACCGGIGKVNAAMSTQLLIDHYHPDLIINVGVAGCTEKVDIGSVVLADGFLQHDMDTTAIGDPIGFVSTVNQVLFPTADLSRAKAAMDKTGIPYRVGTVATGDWFVVNGERARWIADTFHPLLCEMEGGAAAQVCLRNQVPFMALKAVSDCIFSTHETFFDFPAVMKDLNRVALSFIQQLRQ